MAALLVDVYLSSFTRTVFVNNSNNKTATTTARFAFFFFFSKAVAKFKILKRNFLWFFVFLHPKHRRAVRCRSLWEHRSERLCSAQESSACTVSCNSYCKHTPVENTTQQTNPNKQTKPTTSNKSNTQKPPTPLEPTHRWTNLLLFS